MLTIFKPKYFLKDILPSNYVDIHNHLLAGIDDGSKTIEETAALISLMKALNVDSAIAIPHTYTNVWDNTPETIKAAFTVATKNKSNNSFLKGYASEYMLDISLITRLKKEPLLCIHENYILVEFPLFMRPINLYDMLFEIKIRDYKIIIAHPERYVYFPNSFRKYEKLKEYGVYFQLNLLALVLWNRYSQGGRTITRTRSV